MRPRSPRCVEFCLLFCALYACGDGNVLPNGGAQPGGADAPGAQPAPGDPTAPPSPPTPPPANADAGTEAGATGDVYKGVFDAVDKASIQHLLEDLTGANAITEGGRTFRITNRWAPASKANFRAYWLDKLRALGATAQELAFPIAKSSMDPNHLVDETEGHDVEAILPGRSADSIVIVTHYDTVGLKGKELENPGADDAGSGLAVMMEAARIFAAIPNRKNTIRFVAADYEEISDNLDGDVAYVKYLQAEAAAKGFKILLAADNDQIGWSCWSENRCTAGAPAPNSVFRMTSCSGDAKKYDYPDFTKGITDVADKYGAIEVFAECDGSGDTDHYSFWQAGIPAYVIEEYDPDQNPHYDDNDTGDDTLAHVDLDYLFHTAQVAITYQAQLVGLE